MATAQKRGFRFPWGNDGHHDAPAKPATPPVPADDDETSLARRLGTVSDDLGRGPFDLPAPAPEPEPETEPEAEPAPVPEAVSDASSATTDAATADAAEDPAGADDSPEPAAPAMTEPAPAPVGEAAPAGTAWPAVDRRSAESAREAAKPPAPTAPRRDNPLVTGLVKAMRDAAKTARDEAVANLHREAVAREEGIRARSAVAAAELRKVAESDVAAIKEWSKAELARVREETEGRTVARRMQLLAETEAEAEAAEDLVRRLGEVVAAYEAEAASFFEALLAEADPARLAGLAERMPPPPALDAFPVSGDGSPAPVRARRAPAAASGDAGTARPARRRAAAAPMSATVAVADVAVEAESVETTAAEAEPHAEAEPDAEEAAAPEPADETAPERTVPDWLDPAAAAAAEAESLAGLDCRTNVIVSGLTSVGGIAGFKLALMHVPGVTAINVAAGEGDDVQFTVTHAAETDMRDAMRSMDSFEPRLIADDGDTLVVVARETAA